MKYLFIVALCLCAFLASTLTGVHCDDERHLKFSTDRVSRTAAGVYFPDDPHNKFDANPKTLHAQTVRDKAYARLCCDDVDTLTNIFERERWVKVLELLKDTKMRMKSMEERAHREAAYEHLNHQYVKD